MDAVAVLLRRLGLGEAAATAAAPDVVYTSAFEARFHPGLYDATMWPLLAEVSTAFPACSIEALFDGPYGIWGCGTCRLLNGAVEGAEYWPDETWHADGQPAAVLLGVAPNGAMHLVRADQDDTTTCPGTCLPAARAVGWCAVQSARAFAGRAQTSPYTVSCVIATSARRAGRLIAKRE